MENEEKIRTLETKVSELTNMLDNFKRDYEKHQHDNFDGTKTLTKDIEIGKENYLSIGYAEHGCAPILNLGAENEQIQYAIDVSKDNRRGFSNKTLDIAQFNILHQPNNTSKQSFITGVRGPVVTPNQGQTISTTSGGNTITISGFGFTTNELAGCSINIINSSGALVETRTIASNTDTVITISGTWSASTTGGTFEIHVPLFFGSSQYVWQRFYTQEGTGGGIRFGEGPTAGGQNGLLYMNATGDLYWRNKGGTATKLN